MVANKRKQIDQAYQKALATHLARKPTGAATSRSARKIGNEAISCGLNAIEPARTHDFAMNRLSPEAKQPDGKQEAALSLSPAAVFYTEALAPLEKRSQKDHAKSEQTAKALERQLQREVKQHNKLLSESQSQQRQVRQLTYQFFLAQEQERKEISRDLHDEIAQVLAGINVRLTALKKVAQIGKRDIGERIDQTQKLVEQSVAAVHRYALRLRPSLLDDLGLVPSIRSYIKNFPGGKNLSVRFKADSEADFLTNEQRTALYRVTQEALTNIVRHACAKNVKVSLCELSDRIRLEICDDGKSFNAKRILNSTSSRRLGLIGMRERVEMLGGTFSIESEPDSGTSVIAEIPLPKNSAKIDR